MKAEDKKHIAQFMLCFGSMDGLVFVHVMHAALEKLDQEMNEVLSSIQMFEWAKEKKYTIDKRQYEMKLDALELKRRELKDRIGLARRITKIATEVNFKEVVRLVDAGLQIDE